MGLAFATGATIVLEIVLTRIFSVILWYHYGFMTISLALLGLGLAGIVVYLDPQRFRRESAAQASARAGLAFAATAFLAILGFHWIVSVETHWPLGAGYRILIFLVVLVPFFFAGLAVAIPISRFTERIGALYAADLFGAAVGAIAVVPLIGWLGGHPVVIVCAGLACLSAAANAVAASRRSLLGWALLGLVICVVAVPVTVDSGLFRIRYGKHTQKRGTRVAFEHQRLVERWNSFSRVAVYQRIYRPFGWNFGVGAPRSGSYLPIRIDGGAMTPMIPFEGDFGAVEYLRYDMTSLGYQIRRPRSALIIGSGGGRDILTAKLFGVRDIRAVEVNPIIVDFVRKDFRAVSGSPYDLSGVSWTVADGRSYAAESDE